MVTTMGAETLPFLSAFGVLPASLAFFVVYNKLVAKLPPRLVFAAAVTPLAAFYVLFATVIYPAADVLHPYGATAWVRALPGRPQPQHGKCGWQQARRRLSMQSCVTKVLSGWQHASWWHRSSVPDIISLSAARTHP